MRSLVVLLGLLWLRAAMALELASPGMSSAPGVIVLEPIAVSELGGRSRVAIGGMEGAARAVSRSLEVAPYALTLPEPVAWIERELPLVFRLRASEGAPPRVRAEWIGADGRPGSRVIEGEAASGGPVRVRVLGPWPVASDERGTVYEGRLLLELPLAGITRAGQLSGRVELFAEHGP
jgi:hypothetical protein